jgi:hypothetical protein
MFIPEFRLDNASAESFVDSNMAATKSASIFFSTSLRFLIPIKYKGLFPSHIIIKF